MSSQLSRLKQIAKRNDPTAIVTYSKRYGYFLTLEGRTASLGKDSVDALFCLEDIFTKKGSSKMPKYFIKSSQLKPCYFDARHEVVGDPAIHLDYSEDNPQGAFQAAVIEAKNDFLAGIEFIRQTFPFEELRDLIDLAIENSLDCHGGVSKDLSQLINLMNRYLPEEYRRIEGEHFGLVELD